VSTFSPARGPGAKEVITHGGLAFNCVLAILAKDKTSSLC
jgi:hypothetical protein